MSKHRRPSLIKESDVRKAYLYGYRILQWAGERLPIDVESCKMRGMAETQWHFAHRLLTESEVMDSQLRLLVPLTMAQDLLQAYSNKVILIIRSIETPNRSTDCLRKEQEFNRSEVEFKNSLALPQNRNCYALAGSAAS